MIINFRFEIAKPYSNLCNISHNSDGESFLQILRQDWVRFEQIYIEAIPSTFSNSH
jgi:hypothetical protein